MKSKRELEAEIERLERQIDARNQTTAEELDRPRGVATKAAREYLVGEMDGESRQRLHNRQQAVRKRLAHSIKDLALFHQVGASPDSLAVSEEELEMAVKFLQDLKANSTPADPTHLIGWLMY